MSMLTGKSDLFIALTLQYSAALIIFEVWDFVFDPWGELSSLG